jgi:hypothetical protein
MFRRTICGIAIVYQISQKQYFHKDRFYEGHSSADFIPPKKRSESMNNPQLEEKPPEQCAPGVYVVVRYLDGTV